MTPDSARRLGALNRRITRCRRCPRLVEWREATAREKRAAYAGETYWGKPVPSFGDPDARILIAGLAPAAHGANRTGRMFTGDRSGLWLYRALHRAGLANHPGYLHPDDGLLLSDVYISAIVHCAPPANRPTPAERDACLEFLTRELDLLPRVNTLLCLGAFAWDGALRALARRGVARKPKPRFGHGAEATLSSLTLLGSYHPSQQNTFTGRLTEPMFDRIFVRARELAEAPPA